MHKKVANKKSFMKQNTTNTNAFLIHISAFAGFVFPFGQIITPLIAWQTLKQRSPFLDAQGKEAVNFNLSYTLYAGIISLILGGFFVGSIFRNLSSITNLNALDFHFHSGTVFNFIGLSTLTGIVTLTGVALVIIAALKAKEGENYQYPFTIKFIK